MIATFDDTYNFAKKFAHYKDFYVKHNNLIFSKRSTVVYSFSVEIFFVSDTLGLSLEISDFLLSFLLQDTNKKVNATTTPKNLYLILYHTP